MGVGRGVAGLLIASLLAMGAPVAVAAAPRQGPALQLPAGPLSSSLHQLARQARVEIVFDEAAVRGIRAPAVEGRLSAEAALGRLLAGTGLAARRTGSGAFIIERLAPPRPRAEVPAADATPEEAPVPEILVVGRRTQNADIRRRENDVQPYRVTSGKEVLSAHRDNIDDYFRSRITSNTQVVPPSLSDQGETVSQIDLRGIGSDGTLVLVDGRRLPSIPGWTNFELLLPDIGFGFRQPDLNAIPLHAVERIETLTGTAGGIYGFGALGGVVNVVIARNYRGVELHGTTGVTSRGDARRLSVEGRLGFSPDGGRTDVMLYASHAESRPLLVGQRDYAERDLERSFHFDPDSFSFTWPLANSVFVTPLLDASLSLKPEFGGGTLGVGQTFLPVGFAGTPAEMVQALRSHAGQRDFSLSEGQANTTLGSTPTTSAAILNVRHRFGGGVEGYLDGLVLRNTGEHVGRAARGVMLAFDSSPINPFNESVLMVFPLPGWSDRHRTRFTTSRYTAGLVADLPLGWRGTAELTFGSVRAEVLRDTINSDSVFLGPPYGPDLNPLGDWQQFQSQAFINPRRSVTEARTRNRYREQSVRLAGPLFRTSGGTVTLSLLGERRSERVPAFTTATRVESGSGDSEQETITAPRGNLTTSLYGELRAPLLGDAAPFPLVRNLELQLATRYDRLRTTFDPDPRNVSAEESIRHHFGGTSFTAGARSRPTPWLMLRASYATGSQPPALYNLVPKEETSYFAVGLDPKRGNNYLGWDGPFLHKTGGNPELRKADADTLSIGAVLNPDAGRWPRLAVDYSIIRKRREAISVDAQFLLDHEELWPDRVVRAPLTDLDRALGYTGGAITVLDDRAMNAGQVKVDSIDGRLDWLTPFIRGKLHLYGVATLQMRNRQKRLDDPPVERAGFRNGPLKWRVNGGVDWSIGATTVGANAQFFSHYDVDVATGETVEHRAQGSRWVRSAMYVDLYASHTFVVRNAGPLHQFTIDFGLVNLFDKAPPRETGYRYGLPDFSQFNLPGYSRYGDPRRRRLELALSAGF